ncbi:MAG TPA: alkaline phosphatase family protein, partial [Vicinamibacterales bacterium]|nr:alkaline phosphatase family protein [Vicinamibacterales bacterium]
MKRIILASAAVCLAIACGRSRPPEKFHQKLVVLGFDGMDPRLVTRWMDEGKLPNMKKLAGGSAGVHPLETTHSPESPTAWASFATGVNAGKHNIFDFLVRDTHTYLPDLGMVERHPPRFILNYIPVSRPEIRSIRGGTSFWVTAGKAGVRSSELT